MVFFSFWVRLLLSRFGNSVHFLKYVINIIEQKLFLLVKYVICALSCGGAQGIKEKFVLCDTLH